MSEAATTVEGDGIEKTGVEVPADGTTVALKAKQAMTEYLVLSKEAAYWTEQKKIAAASATAAIRAYLAVDNPDPDGTYVAVPARSWKPVTVKTETQKKLTLT